MATAKASQFVFLAGQTATDHDGNVVGAGDFEAQCRQVFGNVETALQSVGAGWRNVAHFTNYLVSFEDQPKFVKFRMGFFPKAFPDGYPPNTLLYVGRFVVLGHGRRQLLWFEVTRHPTAEWLARHHRSLPLGISADLPGA